jgi:hypothetical protein
MTSSSQTSTGYGPSDAPGRWNRLYFDGDERKYEQWEVKFLGYMRLRKLKDTILPAEGQAVNATKNEEAFAELIQFLDDRSLSLVMRDAMDNGQQALKILREHYAGTGKPRVISLYTELTSLRKSSLETMTDYVIKAETIATALRNAGENISDGLLVAMVLKGLPTEYKPFVVVTTQSKKQLSFAEFKVALRSFEDTERSCSADVQTESVVMKTADNRKPVHPKNRPGTLSCYACGQKGHKADSCVDKSRNKLWCSLCKTSTHTDRVCRRKQKESAVKMANDKDEPDVSSFQFKVSTNPSSCDMPADSIMVDCGATTHVLNDISKFTSFDNRFNPDKHFIELADGTRTNNIALKRGNAKVELHTSEGRRVNAVLEDALFVPSYPQNIFSVQAATEKGATVVFKPESAELITSDGHKLDIEKQGRLYYLCSSVSSKEHACDLKNWHEILGHCNANDVLKLEHVVDGMRITNKSKFDCETCTLGKMTQFRNRDPDVRATAPLELVHTDLAGPIAPEARDGFKYAVSFIDDYSSMICIYFLRKKSDTVTAFEKFLADVAPFGKVKRLRSDNGTEFTSAEMQAVLVKHGIRHERSAPYSPHQNGTAERNWRTLFEMARCLLLDSKMSKEMWTHAVATAAYIRNRCYNPRTGKTPYELFTGRRPNLSNMHTFGTKCFGYEQNKTKLDARCKEGIFVGYDRYSPAYLVYHQDENDVKKYRCVKFTEPTTNVIAQPKLVDDDDDIVVSKREENSEDENSEQSKDKTTTHHRYPKREISKPKYLEDYCLDDSTKSTIDYCCRMSVVPQSYEEATSSANSTKWKLAMEDEIRSLNENDTFHLTPLPEGRNSVGGKWVYSIKENSDGSEKFKARYVAKGYSQVQGIDYHETFAPTARIASIRLLLQIAVQYGFLIEQMDVKTAYLNAPIDCDIYVDQAEGFVVKSPSGEELVYKLNKSLYGLKQSGRNWNCLLHNFVVNNGFIRSDVDTCVYHRCDEDGFALLLIWVDDIIVSASNRCLLDKVKELLKRRFKMTDLGQLKWFLGIQFIHDDGVIKMNQTQYLTKLLKRYQMDNCKPRSTPCELKLNCDVDIDETSDCNNYREIVGSLIYAMTCTRPDLCYVVTTLSQHLAKPNKEMCITLKHVLRYIKGTLNYELCFRKCENGLNLNGYSDASWGSLPDRKSITGYCFSLNPDGPLISWKCKKQSTVALSSCEAEYMALAATTQECLFLTQLLRCIDTNTHYDCVTIFDDNQGAIALVNNPVHHQRSKHIDIKYHFVRDECSQNRIKLEYLPTADMIADIFTKPASKFKLQKFKDLMFGK